MRRIQKGKNKSLKKLKLDYYNILNRDKSVSSKCIEGRIDNVYNTSTSDEKNFWNEFRKDNYKLIKKVCIGDPKELNWLKKHIGELLNKYNLGDLYEYNSKGQVVSIGFGKKISSVFNYKSFRSSKKANWLCDELDIDFCPYCNLEKLTRPSNGKLEFDLDHFFCKVRYPFFGLSFYNLIPSCHKCNSSYKGTADFSLKNYIHPYRDDFNSGYEFKLNRFPKNDNDKEFKIELICKSDNKSLSLRGNNHIRDFDLETRYQEYKEHVMSVYSVYCEYTNSKIVELNELVICDKKVFDDTERLRKIMFNCAQIPFSKKLINKTIAGKLKLDMVSYFQINFTE